eukprot:scaffold3162_cov101-Isochrysis_galbana.AAC.10
MALETEPCESSARSRQLGTDPASRNSTRMGCRRSSAGGVASSAGGAGCGSSPCASSAEEVAGRPEAISGLDGDSFAMETQPSAGVGAPMGAAEYAAAAEASDGSSGVALRTSPLFAGVA